MKLSTFALTGVLVASLSSAPGYADILVTISDNESDLTFNYAGSIDTTGLGAPSIFLGADGEGHNSAFTPTGSVLQFAAPDGPTFLWKSLGLVSGPALGTGAGDFHSNPPVLPDSSTGSGWRFSSGVLSLPNNYISGTEISGSMTFGGQTIASQGIIPGPHVYTIAGSTSTITIQTIPAIPPAVVFNHLAPPAKYDNRLPELGVHGQTFTSEGWNIMGFDVYIDDPTRPDDPVVNELEGPVTLLLYDASDLQNPVLLVSRTIGTASSILSGLVSFDFLEKVPTEAGNLYFFGLETPDSFGLGLRDLDNNSTYSGGTQATLLNGVIGLHHTGRDLSFRLRQRNSGGNFVWARRMGGKGHEGGQGVATDASGNIYTVGFFRGGPADFDPGPQLFELVPSDSEDAFICKMDHAGNLVWVHQFGGIGRDYGFAVTTDASGNVYLTGSFEGTVDFDPGLGTFNLVSAGSEDVFVCKLDSEGNFVWAQRLGGSDSKADQGRSIVVDASGNVFITGRFGSGGVDAFVSKVDPAGNVLWVRQFGGGGFDNGTSIAIDGSGGVYTTGNFSGTADFDPGPGSFNLTSQFSFEIFLSKLDSDGNFVWAGQIGGSSSSSGRGTGIATDSSGNVFATGVFRGETDFDPGPGSHILTVEPGDVFISKFDGEGNFVWVRQFSGDEHDDEPRIAIDTSGNIFTAGGFGGTVDFDPGPGIFNMTSDSAVGRETFVTKLDDEGRLVWARQFDATVFDLALDAFRNVYSTGYFYHSVDFDPGPQIFALSSAGEGDVFVSRLSDDSELVADNDNDGIEDDTDTDDDNDGILDVDDAFPFDASESSDNDEDGIGDNGDPDDDNDGLSDEAENLRGTNPLVADTDGDGLNDGDEVSFSYDPTNPDSDGDGTPDGLDDSDEDGLTAIEEIAAGSSPLKDDTDGDGLKDGVEVDLHGTDPSKPDTDGDLLTDPVEINLTLTNPRIADTDGNGTSDADEDLDEDDFTNLQEVDLLLTDPLDGASRFAPVFAHSPAAHSLTFPALAGRSYRVERSINMDDWGEVITFVGSGSTVSMPLGPPFSQRWFYRVVVSLD